MASDEAREFRQPFDVHRVEVLAGDDTLAWGLAPWAVVWGGAGAECELRGHRENLSAVGVSLSGERVVTAARDARAIVWSACAKVREVELAGAPFRLALLGDVVAAIGARPGVAFYGSGVRTAVPPPFWARDLTGIVALAKGRLAAWNADGVLVLDARGREVYRHESRPEATYAVAESPGDLLFVCGSSGLSVADIARGAGMRRIEGTSMCTFAAVGLTTACDPHGFACGVPLRELP